MITKVRLNFCNTIKSVDGQKSKKYDKVACMSARAYEKETSQNKNHWMR